MNVLDIDVLQHARDWAAAGHRVHLITVVETWGSAPRQAGAMLVIREDGQLWGSVSGGCIEDDLIKRARTNQLSSSPSTLMYGATQDETTRFELPCGGTLQLVVEPIHVTEWLDEILIAINKQQLIARSLDMHTGAVHLEFTQPNDSPSLQNDIFRSIYGPRWRLLIIGANETARVLCSLARALEFQVIVCDPRKALFAEWNESHATLLTTMPDDSVLDIKVDERTAIVAVTHDRKLDDMALLEALKSPAFYVGALGSIANQKKRRERLRLFDLTDQEIERLHGPVGLPIASRTPTEIAVAIAAELILVRNTGCA